MQRLADCAGVDVDLRPLNVGYSAADVVPKKIPDDDLIERTISDISNPQWRYVFALMAVWLRDHEAYLCTLEDRDGALVAVVPDDSKTGKHVAFPVPSKWAELWLMGDRTLPKITVKANEEYGSRFAAQWRRLKAPKTPYVLPHAYAIRCHVQGVKVAIAADWMGHSPDMHLKRYHRWIADKTHREAWEQLQAKPE
ncbi:hypothetical protein [Halomicronema sp. CCY15110]|uniref:hypothetical protein n=1 Tax=Halomicronema sp. CCY15110 TaxID=2767773 RepID=UPI0019520CAD|nr:hypothetical protein [Halomicronema sp. CCY15110]